MLSRLAALLLIAMIAVQTPAKSMAEAAEGPSLTGSALTVNTITKGALGTVLYTKNAQTDPETGAETTTYAIDEAKSAKLRVGLDDVISFTGTITAPEGAAISWIRIDLYTTDTEDPYTAGEEYWRMDNMSAQHFDLSEIPALTVDRMDGLVFEEGKNYILMVSAGDTCGGLFTDTDEAVEDVQGPAVILSIKCDPATCTHPHESYYYTRHSSRETRVMSYGDALTHQVEPLVKRYCGLCDSFLGNIWGQGTPEEHAYNEFGTCAACGYAPLVTLEEDAAAYTITIPTGVNMSSTADGSAALTITIANLAEGSSVTVAAQSANGGKLKYGENEIPYTYEPSITFTGAGEQMLNLSVNPEDAEGMPPGTYTDTLTFTVVSAD